MDTETRLTQEVAATYVNRFIIAVNAATTRITFGEALVGTDATMRSAIVMTTENAEMLAKLLRDLLDQNRTLIEKQRQGQPRG